MKDLMLDIETLGVNSNALITQIGACYFDRNTGEVGETLLLNIDIEDSLRYGFQIDASTLKFWFSQKEFSFIRNEDYVGNALQILNNFSEKAETIWCHATFDMPIVMNAYNHLKIKPSFHYTSTRDIRTLMDLAGLDHRYMKTERKKTHNALDDCLYQVEYCTQAFKKLSEK